MKSPFKMAWMKRGCCGSNLKQQTTAIALFYIVCSLLAMLFGFMLIERPESIAGEDGLELKQRVEHEVDEEEAVVASKESFDSLEKGRAASEERKHYNSLIRHIQDQGVEVIIGSLVTIIFSIMMFFGARQNKSTWLMPWIVQQVAEVLIGAGIFLVYALIGTPFGVVGVLLFLLWTALECYFIFAVFSHYTVIKSMKRHSNAVISSVMDSNSYNSGSAVNYEQLRDEVDGGKEMTSLPPNRGRPMDAEEGSAVTSPAANESKGSFGGRIVKDDKDFFSL